MRLLLNLLSRLSLSSVMMLVVQSVAHHASAAEVTVQNDSVTDGSGATVCPCFIAGESVAAWLTSPCNGNIVAVQVFWRSQFGGSPQMLEESISIFASGAFPTPGPVMQNQPPTGGDAVLQGPVLSDGVANEFRFLDEFEAIPINIPVTGGQEFVVSLKFFNNSPQPFGPSVVFDADGCQTGKNAVFSIPGGWVNACPLGVTGDWFIRAVVDCGAQPGACCEVGGGCGDSVTEATCSISGGLFRGEGTTCAGVTCAQACCFQPSGCLDITLADCGIAGGFAQGLGTDCGTTVCFPAGACCNPDGSCDDAVDPTVCALSGVYQGNNTVCSGVACPQPEGACCLAGGGCLSLTQTDCGVIPNSTWAGAFTGCPDDCTGIPVGACCNADGTCDDGIVGTTCTSGGGIFQGDPSTCAGVTCPAPSGACCVGQTCTPETDADCTLAGGTWSGAATDCADGNMNGVPDECEGPICTTVEDCCDLDANNARDDNCSWCSCEAGGTCNIIPINFADMGGAFGACPTDSFCNIHDRNHALSCFSGVNPCESLNVDAGGAFGACSADGFCNIHDANHALSCFAGNNPCSCVPSPEVPAQPRVVGSASLSVIADARSARPGDVVRIRVFAENALRGLQSYQLETTVTGGRRGHLELVDVAIEKRRDYVFGGQAGNFTAFNVGNGQMLSGLDIDRSVTTESEAYLATYTYRVSADAVGTFVIDVPHDAAAGDQTFLIAPNNGKIDIDTVPTVVAVTAHGARRVR